MPFNTIIVGCIVLIPLIVIIGLLIAVHRSVDKKNQG